MMILGFADVGFMAYGRRQGASRACMIWLLSAIAVAAIVIAGRAHTKRLDERDDLHARGYLNKSWRRD
jgi:hypothetical protein